jgi:hypothetical protein
MTCIDCDTDIGHRERWQSKRCPSCRQKKQDDLNNPHRDRGLGKCAAVGCDQFAYTWYRTLGYNEPLCYDHGQNWTRADKWADHPGGLA